MDRLASCCSEPRLACSDSANLAGNRFHRHGLSGPRHCIGELTAPANGATTYAFSTHDLYTASGKGVKKDLDVFSEVSVVADQWLGTAGWMALFEVRSSGLDLLELNTANHAFLDQMVRIFISAAMPWLSRSRP